MSGILQILELDSGIIIIILADSYYLPAGKEYQYEYAPEPSGTKYKTFMKGSDAQSLEKVFVRKFAQVDKAL